MNIFFFFNTNIKTSEEDLAKSSAKTYENKLTQDDTAEITNRIHYISAAAEAVYQKLQQQNKKIDTFICASDSQDTNYDLLKKEFLSIQNDENPDFRWISYDKETSSDKILKKIAESYEFNSDDTIYIVTNCGIRSNVMFFSTFTQILKNKGVSTKLIYIKEIVKDEKEEVQDVSKDNKYFDVLKAVELFVKTGNPYALNQIYKNESHLQKLLGYMQEFYSNTQICKPVNDKSQIAKIYNDMIDEIDSLINQNTDIDIIFKLLLPTIKEKFQPLKNCNEPFLQILKWCYVNDMILTGYFILDAEFKSFLYQKHIIQFSENGKSIDFPNPDTLKTHNYIDYPYKITAKQTQEKQTENYISALKSYKKNLKNTSANQTECLAFIFRYIVGDTSHFCYNDLTQSKTSDKYKNAVSTLENYLTDWQVALYDESKMIKLFELILLQDFIRNLRNNMAHSSIKYTIQYKENVRQFVRAKFGNRIFNVQYGNSNKNNDITFDQSDIYIILQTILTESIQLINSNIQFLTSKEETK